MKAFSSAFSLLQGEQSLAVSVTVGQHSLRSSEMKNWEHFEIPAGCTHSPCPRYKAWLSEGRHRELLQGCHHSLPPSPRPARTQLRVCVPQQTGHSRPCSCFLLQRQPDTASLRKPRIIARLWG